MPAVQGGIDDRRVGVVDDAVNAGTAVMAWLVRAGTSGFRGGNADVSAETPCASFHKLAPMVWGNDAATLIARTPESIADLVD
jgi:hypothetical protein